MTDKRKIVQVSTYASNRDDCGSIVVLCDDGTLWTKLDRNHSPWTLVENIPQPEQSIADVFLYKKIDHLELTVRARNCLSAIHIVYVGELIQNTESDLLKTSNLGKKSIKEIKACLNQYGLSLGTIVVDWIAPVSRV